MIKEQEPFPGVSRSIELTQEKQRKKVKDKWIVLLLLGFFIAVILLVIAADKIAKGEERKVDKIKNNGTVRLTTSTTTRNVHESSVVFTTMRLTTVSTKKIEHSTSHRPKIIPNLCNFPIAKNAYFYDYSVFSDIDSIIYDESNSFHGQSVPVSNEWLRTSSEVRWSIAKEAAPIAAVSISLTVILAALLVFHPALVFYTTCIAFPIIWAAVLVQLIGGMTEAVFTANGIIVLVATRWIWAIVIIYLIFLIVLFIIFVYAVYYSLPDALDLLRFSTQIVKEVKWLIVVEVVSLLLRLTVIAGILYVLISHMPVNRIVRIGSRCNCTPPYKEGSLCNEEGFKLFCLNKKGGPCKDGACSAEAAPARVEGVLLAVGLAAAAFWGSAFFRCFADMVIANFCTDWYTRVIKRSFKSRVVIRAILRHTGNSIRYHMGTLCAGATTSMLLGPSRLAGLLLLHIMTQKRYGKFAIALAVALTQLPIILAAVGNRSYFAAIKAYRDLLNKVPPTPQLNLLVDTLIQASQESVVGVFVISWTLAHLMGLEPKPPLMHVLSWPLLILILSVYMAFFAAGNVLLGYSTAVHTVYIAYISDVPLSVSRQRKYSNSDALARIIYPDKFKALNLIE